MKKQKSKLIPICVSAIVLFNTIPAFAVSNETITVEKPSAFSAGIYNPFLRMDVSSGSLTNSTKFEETHHLTSKNGETVNFWINNTGSADIRITINGKAGRTFAPGEQGHISTSVSYITSKYIFKATLPNGGKISMDYGIAQR